MHFGHPNVSRNAPVCRSGSPIDTDHSRHERDHGAFLLLLISHDIERLRIGFPQGEHERQAGNPGRFAGTHALLNAQRQGEQHGVCRFRRARRPAIHARRCHSTVTVPSRLGYGWLIGPQGVTRALDAEHRSWAGAVGLAVVSGWMLLTADCHRTVTVRSKAA
jgi:hypothetical protein